MKSVRLLLPPYRPRCSPSLQTSAIDEDWTLAATTRSSHINRPEPTHGGAGFLTSALLSRVALPQGQNHKQWNSFAYKSTSVVYGTVRAPLHNVFQSNMACTSLLIKPCLETNQTQTRPNKSKPLHKCFRACHTHLLLVRQVNCFPLLAFMRILQADTKWYPVDELSGRR